jgi:N-acetylneuraminic acid mutarotase
MGNKTSKSRSASGTNNITTCTWTKDSEGPFKGRFDHTLVKTEENKVLVFGGMSEGWSAKNDLWEYSLEKKEWSEIQTDVKPPNLKDHTAVYHEGKMFVFGGKKGNSFTNALWIFDTKTKKWEEKPNDATFPPARGGHIAVVYRGKMFIHGGDAGQTTLDCLWSYDIASNKWSKVEQKNAPSARLYHTATVIDKKMIITGGFRNKEQMNDMYSYDFDTATWTKLPDCAFNSRSGHLALESRNRLFVHGGELGTHGHGYKSGSDLWMYDLKTQKWVEIQTSGENGVPLGRLGHRGCMISNNSFLIVGGTRVEGTQWNPTEWFHDVWIANLS